MQQTPVWTQELAGRRGVLEVLNPETLRTRSHPLLSEDHMVGHVHAEACCFLKSAYGSIPCNAAKLIPGSILRCSFRHWCGTRWCRASRVTSSRSTSSSIQ